MTDPKVLTPAEVVYLREVERLFTSQRESLCDSHEVQRAIITRLRGLIEGMGHEEGCDGSMCGTCGQARDKHYRVASTVFCSRSVTDARHFQARPCNCVQSKVNL